MSFSSLCGSIITGESGLTTKDNASYYCLRQLENVTLLRLEVHAFDLIPTYSTMIPLKVDHTVIVKGVVFSDFLCIMLVLFLFNKSRL